MRALKVAAIVVAAVIGVFVIAAIALVALFDPNDYKGVAASYVQQRTGRTLAVDEELSLDFFPWLALQTGGITVGNAPGFDDEPFARIASISARVKLMPLFAGAVEVGGIDIDGIELNLARDADLRGNWEDLASLAGNAPAGGQAGAGDVTEPGTPELGGLDVEGIRIENGTVNWRENRTDLRFVLSELEFESGAIRPGAPTGVELGFHLLDAASQVTFEISSRGTVEVADDGVATREFSAEYRVVGPDGEERTAGTGSLASFRVAGDVIELTGANARATIVTATWPEGEQFELAWETLEYDGAAQTLALKGLKTQSGAAAATWQIAGETLTDAPHLTGSVLLAADSAGDLLRLAAVALPEGVDPASLRSLELAATFDARPNDLKLGVRDIDARAFGARVSGAAEIDASTLNARLAIPRFAPSDALTALMASVLPENVDARELGELAFSGAVEMNLESGRTSIRNMSAELLGGSATGELTIAAAGNGRRSVSGSLKTSRLQSSAVAGLISGYLPEKIAAEIGVLAIDARFDYDAAGDLVTVSPFAVEAFGLNATGNAAVTAASSRPRAVGDVRLAEFAPRAVLQRFGQPVPETSDPAALSSATIATRFAIDAENGSFDDLSVKLDDSTLTGSFAVANFADPSYRFDLSADRIDVDRYVPPPAEEAREGQRAAGDIGLQAEPLRAIRIEGQARVGDLKITNLRFQDVATHLAIGDGKATIDSAQAKLYGGEFNGGLFVDANGEMPTMTLRGRAAELQLTPLIEALTGDANVSGTGSFNIDLTGRGPTITDNLRSAAGSMGFALRDGALEGFNLGQVLCLAYNKLQRLPEPPEQPKLTQYQIIQADATVANGVATSPELLARTSFVDLTGSGTLVLADGILDYGMRATMTNSIAIPNCSSMDRLIGGSIPFTIKGPATSPVILPDFGQILQERVRDELQDRLRERLLERLR
jgi:AsmA protein